MALPSPSTESVAQQLLTLLHRECPRPDITFTLPLRTLVELARCLQAQPSTCRDAVGLLLDRGLITVRIHDGGRYELRLVWPDTPR
jgi:hypothetical protein